MLDQNTVIDELAAPLQAWGLTNTRVLENWFASMQAIELQSDEFLVHAGDISQHIYIVSRGLVRLFYITEDGKERNKAFYAEGQLTGAVSAAITASAAPFSIQALEISRVIRADFKLLTSLAADNLEISQLLVKLLSEAFIRNEQREAILLTGNAEQRYRWLQQHEPQWLSRVPQYHIASYLGVDAVSLSRLKRKLDHS